MLQKFLQKRLFRPRSTHPLRRLVTVIAQVKALVGLHPTSLRPCPYETMGCVSRLSSLSRSHREACGVLIAATPTDVSNLYEDEVLRHPLGRMRTADNTWSLLCLITLCSRIRSHEICLTIFHCIWDAGLNVTETGNIARTLLVALEPFIGMYLLGVQDIFFVCYTTARCQTDTIQRSRERHAKVHIAWLAWSANDTST
jgi:hypothetical protein